MMLGTIYDLKKRFDMSEKHYRAALDIDPDFAPAANNLAYLLAAQDKNIDEALEQSYANAQVVNYQGKYFRSDIGFDL